MREADMIDNRQRIVRWLRNVWLEAAADGAPDKIVLRHLGVGDRQADVTTFALPAKPDERALAEVAERIDATIDTELGALDGVQRYVLQAMRETRPIARLPLRAQASTDRDLDGIESEPPNARGLVAQLMRHNELQSRMFAMSMGTVVQTMERTIDRLHAAVAEGDERRLAAMEISETLLTQDHERKALTQMVEDNRVVKGAVIDSIKAAVKHFVGNGSNDKASSPLAELLNKFASSLRPDQFEQFANLFTPEQMQMIGDLIQRSQAYAKAPSAQAPSSEDEAEAE